VRSQTTFSVFRLLKLPRVGPKRVRSILEKPGVLNSDGKRKLIDIHVLKSLLKTTEEIVFSKNNEIDHEEWSQLEKMGVQVLSYWDSEYPERIRKICGEKAPPLLFVQGSLEIINKPSVGFCGSRKASGKGLETARDCSQQLSQKGVNIVSGYAAGIDFETHRTALESGGVTTIVLVEGIFHFRIKKILEDIWDWSRILVISEFSPKMTWNTGNAMRRNSTICGLSDAMILIEASRTGGSISAGKTCLELKIPLFAPVYEGMPEKAKGNQDLLKVGARPLMKKRVEGHANIKPVLDAVFENKFPEKTSVSQKKLLMK